MKRVNTKLKNKIRTSCILILVLCFGAVFAKGSKVLQLNSEHDQLYLMPYVVECKIETVGAYDSMAIGLLQRIQNGNYKGAYQKLFKFSLDTQDSLDNYNFVSKLGNYATDLYLFYQDSNSQIVEHVYTYNDIESDKEEWIREAVFPLPIIYNSQDIYVLADYNSWAINEWYLYSNDGYANHKTILSRQAIGYLVLVFIFLILALVGYLILKNRIIAYYAFYLFATSLYIFKELNTLPFHVFFEYPMVLNFLNESIVGTFLLSVLLYIRSICDEKNSYSFEPVFYKILIVSTVISIFVTSFIIDSTWNLVLSYFVNYGINAYLIIQLITNFKKSIPLRFFFLGISIIVVLGILMELQLYNVINFPAVFYWIIPGLILELLLIGIGIIYGLKQHLNEMNQVMMSNSNLNESLSNLEKKVSHSRGAYQTLIANRGNGALNLPREYLDDPLTQREMEVVQLLNKGYTNQKLADEMFISRNTIKTHLKNIYKKLDVSDREEALEKMRRYGIV